MTINQEKILGYDNFKLVTIKREKTTELKQAMNDLEYICTKIKLNLSKKN